MYRRKAEFPGLKKVYLAINNRFPQHLEQCRAFLRQKSVSATGEGIRETAESVKCSIEELGGKVDLCGNPSFPIVFGPLDRGCPKTLIIYGMYDVQPAEEPNWINPPFEAEIHHFPGLGECIVARGAVNSKGALCGLFNVLKTMKDEDEIPLKKCLDGNWVFRFHHFRNPSFLSYDFSINSAFWPILLFLSQS